ncbi:MAG: hypothetical protein ACJAR1_000644 [Rubritalea sp.]|jgi:uncharacterized protein YlzI (FlbEa/FlbD family)
MIIIALMKTNAQANLNDWDNVAIIELNGNKTIIGKAYLVKGNKQSIINRLILLKRRLNSFGRQKRANKDHNFKRVVLFMSNDLKNKKGGLAYSSSSKIIRLTN